MRVLSVLIALAATVGLLFLVSAPVGVESHSDSEHSEETEEHASDGNGYIIDEERA